MTTALAQALGVPLPESRSQVAYSTDADQLPTYQARLSGMRDNVMALLAGRGVDVSQISAFQPLDPNH